MNDCGKVERETWRSVSQGVVRSTSPVLAPQLLICENDAAANLLLIMLVLQCCADEVDDTTTDEIDAGGFFCLFTCARAGATRRTATKIAFILLPNNSCLTIVA